MTGVSEYIAARKARDIADFNAPLVYPVDISGSNALMFSINHLTGEFCYVVNVVNNEGDVTKTTKHKDFKSAHVAYRQKRYSVVAT